MSGNYRTGLAYWLRGRQPGVNGGKQAGSCVGRRGGAADRHAAELGQLGGRETVDVARDLVLLYQAPAEEQRVVRAERDRDSGLDECPEGNRGLVGCDAERDVRRRADLAGDAGRGEPLDEPRVFHRPDAVPQPVRVQQVKAVPDAARADELASVRCEQQPGPLGDPEGRREVRGRPAPLVVGQPEADDALSRVLHRQPGQRPSVHRMPGSVGGNDDPDPDIRRPGRLLHGIEQKLSERGDPAVNGREPGRVSLELEPPGSFCPLILGDLPHEPAKVIRRAEHRARGVIETLEPEPAALIGGGQLGRPLLGKRGRQRHPMRTRKLDHGRVEHSTGQMQMKMRIGKGRQIMRHSLLSPMHVHARWQLARGTEKRGADGAVPSVPRAVVLLYLASERSLPMRPTPSSRSASLMAYDSRKYPLVPKASPGTTATSASSRMIAASSLEVVGRLPASSLPSTPLTLG